MCKSMDYEKSYKEALERAKKLKAGFEGYNANVAIIEEIFPELAESEDERIRNRIRLCLDECVHSDIIRDYERDECLAYLEKREEHKPILDVFGFKVGDAVRLKDGDGRKHIIKSFEEVKGVHGPNFYHVEFEDDSAIGGIYPDIRYPNGYYTSMEKIEEEQKPAEIAPNQFDGITYGMQGYSTEKSAEWNEEDEWKRNELLKYLEEKGDYRSTWYSWLKSLSERFNLQPNTEWSEEDEKYLKIAINIVASDFGEDCPTVSWLKSLRPQPHWKPSEVQMNEYSYWYKNFIESGLASPSSKAVTVLGELLEQLKKL